MSRRTCLYRHFNAAGELLYVGVSTCALTRLGQHRHASRWYDQIASVTFEWFESRQEALAAETLAVIRELPKHNKQKQVQKPVEPKVPFPAPAPNSSEHLLLPEEAATYLRRTVKTLASWRSAGRGPKYLKLEGRIAYRVSDLQNFVAAA